MQNNINIYYLRQNRLYLYIRLYSNERVGTPPGEINELAQAQSYI